MTDFDFEFCDFIDLEMSFITYNDFCSKCKTIKELYKPLNKHQKRFYKWYVYANIHMKEMHKNAIWEYLNFDDTIYYLDLIKYKHIH